MASYQSLGFYAPRSAARRWVLIVRAHLIGAWLFVRPYLRWVLVLGPPAILVLRAARPPFGLDTLGILAAALGIFFALHAATASSYRLAPISVPEDLVKSGWTGDVIAARVSRECASFLRQLPRSYVGDLVPRGPAPPRIEIPGVKLAIDQVADLLRRAAGLPANLIHIEIVTTPGKAPERAMQLHVYVYRAGSQRARMLGPYEAAHMDSLAEGAMYEVLRHSAPYPHSLGLHFAKNYELAIALAEEAGRDARLPRQMREACWSLAALCHLHKRDLNEALGDLRQAERAHGLAFIAARPIADVLEALENFYRGDKQVAHFYGQLAKAAETWRPSLMFPRTYGFAAFNWHIHQKQVQSFASAQQFLGHAEKIIDELEGLAKNPSHQGLMLTLRAEHANTMIQFATGAVCGAERDQSLAAEYASFQARLAEIQERLTKLAPALAIAERSGQQDMAKIKRIADEVESQTKNAGPEPGPSDEDPLQDAPKV